MDHRYESWVDRQIREAQERGAFDDLPGAGKPLRFLDQPRDENWWIKGFLERERLDASALLPPQLALRREAEVLREAVLRERSEQAVREVVEDYNARVRALWRRPMVGPVVVVRPLDVEDVVARWRAHRETPAAPGSVASAEPPPPASRPALRRRLRDAIRRRNR